MRLGYGSGGVLGLVAAMVLIAGCGQTDDTGQRAENKPKPEEKPAKKKHDHGGWWCDDHGIPEHECSMCLPEDKVKELFKDKKDWCDLHDRAKSQCFKCDPKLKEKFAAKYRAKYGEEPPPIGEEEEEKEKKK